MILIPLLMMALPTLAFIGMTLPQQDYAPSAAYLKEIGIERDEYDVLYETDDHGGFHGDGMYFVVLGCKGKHEEMLELTGDWRELPLPESLYTMIYTGNFGAPAQDGLYEIAEDGCYYFCNRHSDALNAQDTEIFGRYSYNFDLAVYDRENDILCMMVFDT